MGILISAVNLFSQVLIYLILARAIMSWFVRNPYQNKAFMLVYQLSEPMLAPARALTGRFFRNSGIDFSPIIALFAIEVIRSLLIRLLILF